VSEHPLHIVQILPELNVGGVERGTIEFSRYLVEHGHRSTVISNGGHLSDLLLQHDAQHITFPVHKKSLFSICRVRPLRKQLLTLNADIVHVRSRLPAWLVWLAIGRLPVSQRPAIITTFHGLYSTGRYSEIMGSGDQVIAISQCVYDYILRYYPRVNKEKIRIIHRGVDENVFNKDYQIPTDWLSYFYSKYSRCKDIPLVVMPGRITSWKGHRDFIEIMRRLKASERVCHGLIVGDADSSKQVYVDALKKEVADAGLEDMITFVGHCSDIQNIYKLAAVVCNLSNRPEPFGRTVIEALALGVPVVAYDIGGPVESLRACFPEGLTPYKDYEKTANVIAQCISGKLPAIVLPKEFTLTYQAQQTLAVYQRALDLKK
jgi:glycosyltransferase involved in cell wall biosynthesis